jgi:hypothetical protein
MANIEEDMRLGEMGMDMDGHTDRLGSALPYTLVIFALAALAALVIWLVYTILSMDKIEEHVTITEKIAGTTLTVDEKKQTKDKYREQVAYQGAVLGFLVIISYAVVYGALKISHTKK